ncbi:unnamed protein product [Caenorhabditis bovis]|uniref:Uncharacterized protein n=1 Tax=Caenorhabditis bovis TaxID=2654633 RepID=A0A8S1E7C9_9PELO|nr:unnamed protein product [Caenorhabditis bovis]
MAENTGFVADDAEDKKSDVNDRKRSVDIGTSTTQIIIDNDPPARPHDCWSVTCDLFGTRQSTFIERLRPLRCSLIKMQEALRIFQYELERDLKSRQSAQLTYEHVKDCVLEINNVTMHSDLNIPPDENSMLRAVAYELAVLARIIEEVAILAKPDAKPRRTESDLLQQTLRISQSVVRVKESGEEIRDEGTSNQVPAVDEGSLKEFITKLLGMVENLIKYIDKKTERRWWLRDVINFTQAAVKVALFISAAISVAYHENQIAPIVTLIITCIQGITEGFDQYFLKNKSPDEIHISALTTATTSLKTAL